MPGANVPFSGTHSFRYCMIIVQISPCRRNVTVISNELSLRCWLIPWSELHPSPISPCRNAWGRPSLIYARTRVTRTFPVVPEPGPLGAVGPPDGTSTGVPFVEHDAAATTHSRKTVIPSFFMDFTRSRERKAPPPMNEDRIMFGRRANSNGSSPGNARAGLR